MIKDRACKLATRLASDALERPLSSLERLRLRLHLAMCKSCRTCKDEMKLLHDVLKKLQDRDISSQHSLPEKDREAIRRSLKEIRSGSSPAN